MKNEDLREQLAFDDKAQDKSDQELYSLLLTHLKEDKEPSIPLNFSANVKARLQAKHRKETIRENILFGFAILSVIGFGVLSLFLAGTLLKSSIGIPSEAIMLVLVMGGLIVIFQTLDQRLIKRKRINQLLS